MPAGIRGVVSEEWRPVPGFEGQYEVSSLGRVRGLARPVTQMSRHGTPFTRLIPARVLRPGKASNGYFTVMLGRTGGSRCVHELVAEAFHGPRPPGHDTRHKDGSRDNNRADNLEWGTRSQNIEDAIKLGTWFSPARLAHLSTFGKQPRG